VITLVDRYVVSGEPADFEAQMREAVEFMRQRPGFQGQRLVRSLRRPELYYNIAHWDSVEQLQSAVRDPAFAEYVARVNALATSEPHPCRTVSEFAPEPA
jgi:long-chain acyl-CoA synthetase